MVDELFVSLHDFSLVLMPIVGAMVLIYLVVLLRKIISVFSRVDALLTTVDQKVTKLDGPLDTLVRLSRSVDLVHDATFKGIHGFIEFLIGHWDGLNDWFQGVMHKSEEKIHGSPVKETEEGNQSFGKKPSEEMSPILKNKGDV